MDTAEVEALFERTLLGDYDGDDAWAAVHALRKEGSQEVFERAASWCVSDDPLKRARGAGVLCQLRRGGAIRDAPEWMFRDESYFLITRMLEREQDSLVLLSAIHALGHLGNDAAVPLILGYQDHPYEDVRFAVACALGCFPNDPRSVVGLLKLTSDADADVRDWAVIGPCLGSEYRGTPTRLRSVRLSSDAWMTRMRVSARKQRAGSENEGTNGFSRSSSQCSTSATSKFE
jgi:HEAT repeat protein